MLYCGKTLSNKTFKLMEIKACTLCIVIEKFYLMGYY